MKNKEPIESIEPKDICCVCGAVGEAGSMRDINEADFELLCSNCKNKRCTNCNFLRSKMKFGDKRYFCRHRGSIQNPRKQICDFWKKQNKNYTGKETISDYR